MWKPSAPPDEVGGWQNIEQLGFAVAVTCASRDDHPGAGTDGWQYKVFRKPEAAALGQELQSAGCIVGFNTRGFDFRVLQPYVDFRLARPARPRLNGRS
jgi:hypothetical protein